MRSGVEALTSLHQRLGNSKIPNECQPVQQLWEPLPSREQLGSEFSMAGYVVPQWVKAQALGKLVPQEQLSVIVSRPELSDYGVKLLWVKAQSQQVSAAAAPK